MAATYAAPRPSRALLVRNAAVRAINWSLNKAGWLLAASFIVGVVVAGFGIATGHTGTGHSTAAATSAALTSHTSAPSCAVVMFCDPGTDAEQASHAASTDTTAMADTAPASWSIDPSSGAGHNWRIDPSGGDSSPGWHIDL